MGGGLSLRGVSSGSSYIAVTAYPSVYFIFVISESENDMYRSCIRSKFPIRGKIELQFANHGLHENCIYCIILYYIVLYYITLRYIMLCYTTLHSVTLHYIILYYIILYYIILYYIIELRAPAMP